jgi:thioredoxin-related protein
MSEVILPRERVVLLALLIVSIWIAGLGGAVPVLAQAPSSAPEDRFADEPKRPRAEAPVRFSKSWDEARAEAKRTGRRLLVYFTGKNCGWCRVLEKRTLTDAEVVDLTGPFVCVEIDVGEESNLRLADEFRIDTIPRSYVLTPEGQVIDRCTGYLPAAEYVAWLKGVGTKPAAGIVAAAGSRPTAPAPAGEPEARADVVIWYVDANRGIERWNDRDWTGHGHLLRLLRAAGLHPRVEHIAREDFPERWDRAEAARRLPELLTTNGGGLVRGLERKGQLLAVQSERLAWMTEVASCADFKGRLPFLVAGSAHEAASRRAVDELLRPGPENPLPGPVLAGVAGRAEAAEVAARAVAAYISGDPEGLRAVASSTSPQLSRCTQPEAFRRGWVVETGEVELRGNEAIAFARVEMRFRGKAMIGADPVAVVLRREDAHWKAFSVGNDVFWIRALPEFCRLAIGPTAGTHAPPVPRLLHPDDDRPIGQGGRSFAWEVPAGGAPLAAQVGEVLLDEKGSSWPLSRIKVYPGEPRSRSLTVAATALDITGLTSDEMRWCVWAIGADGQIVTSEVRRYLRVPFKP